jgi:hypothetical protein
MIAVLLGACSSCQNEATAQSGGARESGTSSRGTIARTHTASSGAIDLSRLRKTHPRLLVTVEDFGRARALAEGDPVAREWREKLRDRAVKFVSEPPLKYPPRGSLLGVSREAFLRIITLAGSYRLTNDPRFSKRATEEMLAIAQFPDWGPKDFLATGEMTAAMAIGYDWLYDTFSQNDRVAIRDAILSKGVRAGLEAYRDHQGWTEVRHNWNFVCNGGMVLGALAIADEAPQNAARMLALARESMENAMRSFAPDGGWEEGPSYWNYATRYATYAFAAMETALGNDSGLPLMRGFSRTGLYRIEMEGPSGRLFNYSDCDEGTGCSPQLFWMARHFQQPAYAAFEVADAKNDPTMMDLLWYASQAPVDAAAVAREAPLAAEFRNVGVVVMRGSWTDRNTTWVGFKGGRADAHHGHLDLGAFVLDALGQRWAVDPGADSYNLPDYFDEHQRWTYYRCRTEGHNTLTVNATNQQLDAVAPIIAFEGEDPARRFAVVELTNAYWHARRAMRGIMLMNGRDVIVQDELQLSADSTRVVWNFHTRAQIDVNGAEATLRQGNQTLRAQILSPAGGEFEIRDVNLPPPQRPDPDLKNLAIRIATPGGKPLTIAVLLTTVVSAPQRSERPDSRAPNIRIVPLNQWIESSRRSR